MFVPVPTARVAVTSVFIVPLLTESDGQYPVSRLNQTRPLRRSSSKLVTRWPCVRLDKKDIMIGVSTNPVF